MPLVGVGVHVCGIGLKERKKFSCKECNTLMLYFLFICLFIYFFFWQSVTVTLQVCPLHLRGVELYHQVNFASAKTGCMEESAMNVAHCSGTCKPLILMAVKV